MSRPNYSGGLIAYSCTTPTQPGAGNITNEPLLLDWTGGNLRLQFNSPCINAGGNAYIHTLEDLDGNERVKGGTVDIGAYEFQDPTSILSYAWLQQYGLATDGTADYADPDGDGHNNWQEWRCGTDPTNALSVLRLLMPSASFTNVVLTWQSEAGLSYVLDRSTNLQKSSTFTPVATNILGQEATTTYIDTNAPVGSLFYRVGVNSP